MSNPKFITGDISTNFIKEEYPEGFSGAELTSHRQLVFLCAAVSIFLRQEERADTITGQISNASRQLSNNFVVAIENKWIPIRVKKLRNILSILYSKQTIKVNHNWSIGDHIFSSIIDGEKVHVQVRICKDTIALSYQGKTVVTKVRTPRTAELEQFMQYSDDNNESSNDLIAAIAGRIVDIKVKEGDTVKSGDPLIVIEAMKMENVIQASDNKKIIEIKCKVGDSTTASQVLMTME